jgi:hypothetical protein
MEDLKKFVIFTTIMGAFCLLCGGIILVITQ